MRAKARRVVAAGAVLLLAAGCAQGKAATAIADGDQAAGYVSAKFADTLDKVDEDFSAMRPRKSKLDKLFHVNGSGIDAEITTVQVGNPPAELVRNHSKSDLNDYTDNLHPAGEKISYVQLGPAYASLAPTPWVSMPSEFAVGDLGACATGTYITACKMINAAVKATKEYRAAKVAKRAADGSVTLEVDLTFRTFIDLRVELFPQDLIAKFTEPMLDTVIASQITLGPQGTLQKIQMTGKFTGKSKIDQDVTIDIQYGYELTEGATEKDIPAVPEAAQVTVLADDVAVDDFNRRKAEIQGR